NDRRSRRSAAVDDVAALELPAREHVGSAHDDIVDAIAVDVASAGDRGARAARPRSLKLDARGRAEGTQEERRREGARAIASEDNEARARTADVARRPDNGIGQAIGIEVARCCDGNSRGDLTEAGDSEAFAGAKRPHADRRRKGRSPEYHVRAAGIGAPAAVVAVITLVHPRRSQNEIIDPVTVDVPGAGDRSAEPIVRRRRQPEAVLAIQRRSVEDRWKGLAPAEEYIRRSGTPAEPVRRSRDAEHEVIKPVTVDITGPGGRGVKVK